MPVTITTKGYIELHRNGVLLSRHSVETEAIEKAFADWEANGDATYRLKFPEKEIVPRKRHIIPVPIVTNEPPSAPALVGTKGTTGNVSLSWSAATPASGTTVASYKVYRNNVEVQSTTGLSASFTGLSETIAHLFQVSAVSNYGAESVKSNQFTASWPYWSDGLGDPFVSGNIPQNTPFEYNFQATEPAGNPIPFDVTNPNAGIDVITPAQVGTTRALTIRSLTGLTASSYTVAVDLAGNSAESDWLARSRGAGVVWAHDFRYPEELTAFMGANNGSEPIPYRYADGPTGFCLRYVNEGGQPNMTANWGRILSPVYAGQNGLPYDDPAAGGTITRRNWVAGSKLQHRWGYGYYGHPTYHAAYPNWVPLNGSTPTGSEAFEGSEFYLQFRIKISGSRFSVANVAQNIGSKLWFIDAAGWLSNQQLVGLLPGGFQYWGTTQPWFQYTNRGTGPGGAQGELGGSQGRSTTNSSYEPGGDYGATCLYGYNYNGPASGACWWWPTDKWVTVHMRIKPGRHNTAPPYPAPSNWTDLATYRETEITVQVHVEGGSASYTTIYDKRNLVWVYGDYNTDVEDGASSRGWGGNFGTGAWGNTGRPLPGFNQFAPTIYANTPDGAPAPIDTYSYQFTQIIFSRQPIACPQS